MNISLLGLEAAAPCTRRRARLASCRAAAGEQTRATTLVSAPAGFSTWSVSARLTRSHASCTASLASPRG